METKRRHFITSAGTIGVASLVLPGSVIGEVLAPAIETISMGEYQARTKEWLLLHDDSALNQGELKLIKVQDSGSSAQLEQFALVLRSRRYAEALADGYYNVAGETFGLYIKHTHAKRDKQFYRAEFALIQ